MRKFSFNLFRKAGEREVDDAVQGTRTDGLRCFFEAKIHARRGDFTALSSFREIGEGFNSNPGPSFAITLN